MEGEIHLTHEHFHHHKVTTCTDIASHVINFENYDYIYLHFMMILAGQKVALSNILYLFIQQ